MSNFYLHTYLDIEPDQPMIALDRDGTINQDLGTYCHRPDDFTLIPGALNAIRQLNQHGYAIVIISNQGGIAKGLFTPKDVDLVHTHLLQQLPKNCIHATIYSPSSQPDYPWAKPNPGLFHELFRRFPDAHWSSCPYVGDKTSDLKGAQAAGLSPVLVRTGYGSTTEKTIKTHPWSRAIPCFDSLATYVTYLLTSTPIKTQ